MLFRYYSVIIFLLAGAVFHFLEGGTHFPPDERSLIRLNTAWENHLSLRTDHRLRS